MTSRTEVASFGYHEVTDTPGTAGFQRAAAVAYKLTQLEFDRHLDAIATAGHSPELVSRINFAVPGRHLLLTFDDGGSSALYAADALCRRGWIGHFFIVTGLIGQRTFLDAAGIREIHRAGHLIGSHSHTHPDIFRELAPEQMREEWRVSADRLAQLLGEPCEVGSVPGGDISGAVPGAAAAAGIRLLFTSEPRTDSQVIDGCRLLGRYVPKVGTAPSRIRHLAGFRGWTSALMARRAKVVARRALPPVYRALVRHRTRSREPGPD